MRIALAQINPILADFNYNKQKILDFVIQAKEKKADLIVFPEASLFGYHPFDLLEREQLIDEQMQVLKKLTKEIPAGIGVLVGGFLKNKTRKGRPYFNTAFLCVKGRVVRTFHKELLPTGDVFDEARFIERGRIKDNFFTFKNKKFLLTICEDIWAWEDTKGRSLYADNPLKSIPRRKIDLVINMSASPFYLGKLQERQSVVSKTARLFQAPMAYVNMVGAQDEIIYDGQSFLVDRKGKIKFQCRSFEEDINIFDLDTLEDWNVDRGVKNEKPVEHLRKALVMGLRDYTKKTGISQVHLGISGGIDSAVVACIAVDALGPKSVKLFALPTNFNLPESHKLAEALAKNLQVAMQTVSIQSLFEQFRILIDSAFSINEFQLVHENIQSRIRGLFLMAYSNLKSSLLLNTGNKSELATGYCTLYGDMCGGLSVIGDLTKQQVYELARHYNQEYELIPSQVITRAPSAELRPNQKDQDSLPDYKQLDKAVVNLVEKRKKASGQTENWLLNKLDQSEFKRWQAPPILKVSAHSFGRGRRYPIAHRSPHNPHKPDNPNKMLKNEPHLFWLS